MSSSAPIEAHEAIDSLWYTRCPVPTASAIALTHGWLEEEFARDGIRLRSIQDSDDPKVRISHFNHRISGMFREGGNIPPIWARSRGQNTRVVGLTWIDEFQAVLTTRQSGITKPEDLRGRRIALPSQPGERIDFARAMSLHGVVSTLKLGGVDPSEVVFVDVVEEQSVSEGKGNGRFNDEEIETVLNGRADVAYVKGAVGVGLQKEHQLRVVVDLGAHPDPLVRVNNGTPRPITVDAQTAEQRPDLVARYLANLLRAAEWAKSNPEQVVCIIAKEVDRSPDDVRLAYGPRLNHAFGIDLSPIRVAGLAAQKDFLLQWNFIERDFDVADWIDPKPLAEALEIVGR